MKSRRAVVRSVALIVLLICTACAAPPPIFDVPPESRGVAVPITETTIPPALSSAPLPTLTVMHEYPKPTVCGAAVDPVASFAEPIAMAWGVPKSVPSTTRRDPAAIQSVVRDAGYKIGGCYADWRRAHPGEDPKDNVPPENNLWPRIRLSIDPSGAVTEAVIHCQPEELRACLEEALRSMSFGASEATTTVVYP